MTLIERLEGLTGRDSLSNRMIADAIGIGPPDDWERRTSSNGVVYMDEDCWTSPCGTRSRRAPNYTGSIDAAMCLVPEGMHWQCGFGIEGENGLCDQAYAWASKKKRPPLYRAATPAIALCIAALKAVQS